MARPKSKRSKTVEADSTYLLKLVMYLIIGSLWLKITHEETGGQIPIPAGFIIGVLFVRHEHFQIDRKVEYALLLIALLVGFWLPIGLYISL
jgi:hypothetical protein